jgi:putative Holliday junction resolvase
LGVDLGAVRVGIAISDPDRRLATPLVTLPRDTDTDSDLDALAGLVAEHGVTIVVVGLPRSLSGAEGAAARAARDFASSVELRIDPVRVVLADERLTTVTAGRTLTQRGVRGQRQRAVIDQAAAVLILQGWLDAELSRAEKSRHG